LQGLFINAGFTDVKVGLYEEEGKNLEPVQILVEHERCAPSSEYTRPYVKIEIGTRSLREPITNRKFSSLVDEYYSDKFFADKPITVPCVNPERTFLEKLFLLHEEFQKQADEIRIDRLSRHLYDIEMLMRTEFADVALANNELYNEIIEHRSIFTKISGIDYTRHQPELINPVPPDSVMDKWAKDYQRMQLEMIYGESLSFEQLIQRIKELKYRINNLDW
jgi:hypothetical protein